jgi:hypothetical protein
MVVEGLSGWEKGMIAPAADFRNSEFEQNYANKRQFRTIGKGNLRSAFCHERTHETDAKSINRAIEQDWFGSIGFSVNWRSLA